MSVMSPQQAALEKQMRRLFDELDHMLEERFGKLYPLHPNRLKRGKAAAVSYDGLFGTAAKFTAGFGSEAGRGYIVHINISTLAAVSPAKREQIEEAAVAFLEDNLHRYFPDRELSVVKDGNLYKIVGDFSLGAVQ